MLTSAPTVPVHDHRSAAPADGSWDALLQSVPGGEFHQTTAFGRIKEMAGWCVCRTFLQQDGALAGGFQLMYRPTRLGRIGYVSRGPVLRDDRPLLVTQALDALLETTSALRLRALLVQPPAAGPSLDAPLRQRGFLPNRLERVITATLVVDTVTDADPARAGRNSTTRKLIRRATRCGVTTREGALEETGLFHQLMLETCRRQDTSPNPARAEMLTELWRCLTPPARCRLTFATCDGKTVAGLFCIGFNQRLSLWKKGSLPEHLNRRPVHLLYDEALGWAAKNGFRLCDFCSVKRSIADKMIAGEPLAPEDTKGRDMMNLGFGGRPELLAEPLVYFPSPFLRQCYRFFMVNRLAAIALRRFYAC